MEESWVTEGSDHVELRLSELRLEFIAKGLFRT